MQRIPIERKLAEAARRQAVTWTADCLEPDALIALIETQEETPETTARMAHVLSCAYCRHEMEAMEHTLSRAAKAQALQNAASSAVSPAPATSLYERWQEIFRFPAVRFGLATAGAVAVALLAFRLGSQQPEREITRLQSELRAARQKQATALAAREKEKQQEQQDQENLQKAIASAREEIRRLKTRVVVKTSPQDILPDTLRVALSASPQERQSVTGSRVILRGNGQPSAEGPALLAPVATGVTDSRPTFRWRPMPNATHYQVEILDTQDNLMLRSDRQTAAEWTPAKSLPSGKVYRWFVTAFFTGESPALASGMAKFRVLDKAKAARLSEVNALHLKLGQLYEQANLRDDALREYQAIPCGDPAYSAAQARLRAMDGGQK